MRSKEESQDYRYFPDPDIYAVKISADDVSKIRVQMPPLAYQLRDKFVNEFKLPAYDAAVLTKSKTTAFYYLECLEFLNEPKKISNWVMVDLQKIVNEQDTDEIPVSAEYLTEIIKLVEDKTVTKLVGLQLLEKTIAGNNRQAPAEIAKSMGLFAAVSDEEILDILVRLKNENPQVAQDYTQNKERVSRFIIGQVMKQTRGKAKSETAEKIMQKVFG
jgi:aspartyl-tRNA(Asn)/glutamyl-tRNA(Gln) amidotransferase subunit B